MARLKKTGNWTGLQVRPIGRVRNKIEPQERPPQDSPLARRGQKWRNPVSFGEAVSELVIHRRLAEGLDGIEDFSHVLVYFWTGVKSETLPWYQRFRTKFHPGGREEFPLVGVFATRSPVRPNPICTTAGELLERRDNVLRVKGLDTFDGTPIIDIKPYMPYYDSVPDAKIAEWVSDLGKFLLRGL